MDRLLRVVSRCFFGALLTLFMGTASAQWIAGYSVSQNSQWQGIEQSITAASDRWYPVPPAGSPQQETRRSDGYAIGLNWMCQYQSRSWVGAWPEGGSWGSWTTQNGGVVNAVWYCPATQAYATRSNATPPATPCAPPPDCQHGEPSLVNGQYVCPPPPECPPLGQDMGAGNGQHSSPGYTGGLVCINGCSAYPRTSGQAPDGTWHAWGPYTSVGFSCSGGSSEGGSAPDFEEPPEPCPTGQCPGTLNGAPICAPCGTGQDRPPPTNTDTTTTNPDGSTTTTSTSTSTQTNCQGASCTTTTTTTTTRTTTPAGGGTPSTETTTETRTEDRPRDDYCTENPRSSQCVESSFGGSCAAQFRCEGDAVQCAIAQEQHKRACTLFEDETDLSAEGRAAVTAGDRPGDHPANEANVLQLDLPSRIDTSPAFAGVGGCPSDITVAGGYTLPFSQLCGPLSVLRPAVIGFGWLIAAFVVFRKR